MATNSHTKKSSIPRATHDCDRPGPEKSNLRGPKPPQKYHDNHSSSKPGLNDGLLKEDEDAVRRSLLELEADHARMKQTLEDTIREAEERLETMSKLMAERERLSTANLDAAADKTTQLEQQVENYEKALIENNIDPATGEVQEPTAEQSAAVEKIKKVTKGDVSRMREKLQEMNENSDKYLDDVQNILRDIEELEATSQRAGGRPVADTLPHDEMMALIKEMEEAQKKEQQNKKNKEEGKEEEEEEEDEGSESSSPTPEDKEESRPTSKSEVFLTQN